MNSFFKIFGWVIKKRKWTGIIILFGVIGAFSLEFFAPYFYKEFSLLFFSKSTIEAQDKAWTLFLWYTLALTIQWTLWRITDVCMILFEAKGMRDLEIWGFEIMSKQSFDFFQNSFAGSLVKKIGKMVRAYEAILDWFLFSFLNIFLNIVIACFLLYTANSTLGIIFLGWCFVYIAFSVGFSWWHLPFNERTSVADSAMGGLFADAIGNINTIFASGSEPFEKKKIIHGSQDLYQKRKIAWGLMFASFGFQGILFTSIELLALYHFYTEWIAGTFSISLFVLFQTIYIPASWNLWTFGKSLRGLFYSIGDLKEFEEIFDSIPQENPNKTNTLTVSQGGIDFEHISFSYPNSNPLFSDFSLHIKPGEKVALVGHSGSGKTTIFKMLFQFIEPQEGSVSIDGQNIGYIRNQSLRTSLSLVAQTPELFHRSLRDNISYALENVSDEQIWEACRKAQCDEFIKNLPEQLDTFVGERGVKLSGGERQRIALARAFLKNTPIVVLDEPTSALDSITEQKIQKGISELLEGKTALVIAHRLSTIFQMDRIIVLDKGEIIETGTHDELLEQNGQYAKMWTHQQGGFLEGEGGANM